MKNLETAILRGNLDEVEKCLEAFDLVEDSRICTRSLKAKRAKLNMITKKSQYNLLAVAIDNKHLDIVELFIKRNFSLEFEKDDYYNETKSSYEVPLLQRSVDTGNRTLVQLLLQSGANVEERQSGSGYFFGNSRSTLALEEGCTAMHHAAVHNYEEIAMELLKYGAAVTHSNYKKAMPMHYAAEKARKSANGEITLQSRSYSCRMLYKRFYREFFAIALRR